MTLIGDRFSDPENAQLLPSYTKFDAGMRLDFGKKVSFLVFGDNLTDAIAITEGNPRTLGSLGVGAILARPILGRSVQFSLQYAF